MVAASKPQSLQNILTPFILFVAIIAAESFWCVSNGLPFPSIDDLAYKYAGFQLVHHGQFAAPALEGYYKGFEKIFLLNPPLYPLCFAAWISVFGFSLTSSLAFGFFIHFVNAVLLYKIVNKLGAYKSDTWGFAAGLVYFFFLTYLDRPETLSILFGLIAYYIGHFIPGVGMKLRTVLAGALMGLAISAQIIVGRLYLIFLFFSLLDKTRFKESLRFMAAVAIISIGVLLLIWLPLIIPNKEYFIEQFIKNSLSNVVENRPILKNLAEVFRYFMFNLPLGVLLLVFLLFRRLTKGNSKAEKPAHDYEICGVLVTVALCIIFASRKSTYFAALLPLIFIASVPAIASWNGHANTRKFFGSLFKMAIIASVCVYFIPAVRLNLLPFSWQPQDRQEVSYRRIQRQVPPGAKILTDVMFWYALAKRATIYDGHFTLHEQIENCDHVILCANGSGVAGVPLILRNPSNQRYMEKYFKVVDSTLLSEPNNIFGVPISYSRSGYRYVLFERKA